MNSVLKRIYIFLFGAIFFAFASFSFVSTQFQSVTDHDHAELRTSHQQDEDSEELHHHDSNSHEHDHDKVHESVSYTHRHAPDQPEHTHDKSHCYSIATGFTALVACEANPVFYRPVIAKVISYFQQLAYASIFISSIFRPPIA